MFYKARNIVTLLSFLSLHQLAAQSDTFFIKVHFLYGSRPAREFRAEESKWFGGKLGGHVGVETDSGVILNFLPSGEFHLFSRSKDRHSRYANFDMQRFMECLGGEMDSNKYLSVTIPITAAQKKLLDSVSKTYLSKTPYDYAFFGVRCAAATYDVLSALNIVPDYSNHKTWRKIFYPKLLRRRILKMAKANQWEVLEHAGTRRRIWEQD